MLFLLATISQRMQKILFLNLCTSAFASFELRQRIVTFGRVLRKEAAWQSN
jgi:hypothetical protein